MKMPNGYGSISKLSGNRRNPYMVRIVSGRELKDGDVKLKRIVLGYFPTRKAAMNALAEYNTNPYDLKNRSVTFSEIYNMWSEKKFDKISKGSVASYQAAYKHLVAIKDLPIREIKTFHMQQVIDQCSSGYQTKKNIKTLCGQIFEYAMENDIVEKNYSPFLELGENKPTICRSVFTEDEIGLLWDSVNRMDFIDTILILIYSGMRIGELLEMQLSNVDLEEKTMKIVRAKNKSSLRTVPIHNRILPLVRKHVMRSTQYKCATLLANNIGKPFTYSNYAQKIWANIMEQLKMDHLPHDTRHTFASRADSAGCEKLCIKRIMGHESKDITDRVYTHKDIKELKEQINLIE